MLHLFRFATPVLAAGLMTACQSGPDANQRAAPNATPTPPPASSSAPAAEPPQSQPPTATPPPPARRALLETSTKHLFSSRQAPDAFVLRIVGDSLLSGQAHFSIVSAAGDTLWREQFPATAFLDYGLLRYGENPTREQRETYVRERVNNFFDKQGFLEPAIKPGTPTARHADAALWKEVRQTGLPGFAYSLYEESGQRLAYLPSQRKAVVYYTCC